MTAAKRPRAPWVLYLAFAAAALLTVFAWQIKAKHTITGDEPRNLMLARSLFHFHSPELSSEVLEEIESGEIFPARVTKGEQFGFSKGPHGFFSPHGLGLPAFLAIPYGLGKTMGARIAEVFLTAFIVLCAWRTAAIFSASIACRAVCVVAACFAAPFIPAAGQFYPDMPGGIICLAGLLSLFGERRKPPDRSDFVLSIAVAFLPWLHIRFSAAALIIVLGHVWVRQDRTRYAATFGIPLLVSLLALFAYNFYAFGSPIGYYGKASVEEVSVHSLMVLIGLFLDQNHGFLFQNPVFFVGVFAIPFFCREDYKVAIAVALVFGSLLVPNAMHVNWYGGGSFSGRFEWAAATVFLIPTIYGLTLLYEKSRRVFVLVCTASILLQLIFYVIYTFSGMALYNLPPDTWLGAYSLFYLPLGDWLPAFYNINWAFRYPPNLAWSCFVLLVLTAGIVVCVRPSLSRVAVPAAVLAGLVGVIGAHAATTIEDYHQTFAAKALFSLTGRVEGERRVAAQPQDKAGYLTFGPYVPLRRGTYRIAMSYSSSAPPDTQIGTWDIFDASSGAQLAVYPLAGTSGTAAEREVTFEAHNWGQHRFEFRAFWNGLSDLQVETVRISMVSPTR